MTRSEAIAKYAESVRLVARRCRDPEVRLTTLNGNIRDLMLTLGNQGRISLKDEQPYRLTRDELALFGEIVRPGVVRIRRGA